jgi:hypothetical protein
MASAIGLNVPDAAITAKFYTCGSTARREPLAMDRPTIGPPLVPGSSGMGRAVG